ncbi:MAG: Holliday junction resolvase-like protein [Candidatus Absconditabacteria bacterium]
MIGDEIIFIGLVALIVGLLIGYLLSKIHFRIVLRKLRNESVQKSKSVIIGQVKEQIAPLLPQFKYNIKDITFIGKGVDYIIFDGLADGVINNVVFLEVKTGKSQLNKNERIIKQAIDKKKVKYEILNI